MSFERLATAGTPARRFGLGLAAVGRPGYLNLGRDEDLPAERSVPALRARTHALLDEAYRRGVRYFDAARSYGRAEEFLGSWLTEGGGAAARDTIVGSKWGYTYTAEWRIDVEVHEVKEHSAAAFERQLAETRARLGDRLDLYQIHSVTPGSPALTDRDLHHRLAALAAEGVTVGLSTSGPAQAAAIRAALEVEVDGAPLFHTVQATWNLLEPSAGRALADAHEDGRTVIVKEGLANGRLAGRHATGPETAALRAVAAAAGAECDAVALAAAAAQPWADVVLSGAATVPQLVANLAAAELELSEARLDRLAALAQPAEQYWSQRAALRWH